MYKTAAGMSSVYHGDRYLGQILEEQSLSQQSQSVKFAIKPA